MSAQSNHPAPKALPALHGAPLLIKREDELDWPEDQRMFYVLAADGLFVARNHEFFRSCVPARQGPSELADLAPFVDCNFPIIPQAIFEQVVGFFDRIAALHNSEASVLLAWDRDEECVRVVVPEQTATVTRYYDGYQHAIGLFYHPPTDLPSSWVVFGDIHSHVNMSAYSSVTDVKDEAYSAGLHLVVGRIYRQDPEFHVEVVVDGQRFELELHEVVEGYEERNPDIPEEWVGRVTIEASAPWWKGSEGNTGSSWSGKSGSCGTSAYESGQDQ